MNTYFICNIKYRMNSDAPDFIFYKLKSMECICLGIDPLLPDRVGCTKKQWVKCIEDWLKHEKVFKYVKDYSLTFSN